MNLNYEVLAFALSFQGKFGRRGGGAHMFLRKILIVEHDVSIIILKQHFNLIPRLRGGNPFKTERQENANLVLYPQ